MSKRELKAKEQYVSQPFCHLTKARKQYLEKFLLQIIKIITWLSSNTDMIAR